MKEIPYSLYCEACGRIFQSYRIHSKTCSGKCRRDKFKLKNCTRISVLNSSNELADFIKEFKNNFKTKDLVIIHYYKNAEQIQIQIYLNNNMKNEYDIVKRREKMINDYQERQNIKKNA